MWLAVSAARHRKRLTHEAAPRVKVDVHDGLCVALEGALHVAGLPVPELDGGVLAGAGEEGPCGVECEACDGCAVGGEGVAGGRAGEEGAGGGGAGGGCEFCEEGCVAVLEVDDLFLEADDACPLFLEEADCPVAGVDVGERGVVLEGGVGVVHPRGVQVGEHCAVAGAGGGVSGGRGELSALTARLSGGRTARPSCVERRASRGLFLLLTPPNSPPLTPPDETAHSVQPRTRRAAPPVQQVRPSHSLPRPR